MCNDRENTPDPLAEFLAQLLADSDIPDDLPTPVVTHPPPPPPPSASTSIPAPHHAPNPHLTCQWVLPNGPSLICGAPLSQGPKPVCDHFRHVHDVRGNEKIQVDCRWGDCKVPPMLRGSLIRHILAVHLGMLKWECEACGKVFSRKGTAHTCVEDG